MKTIYVATRQWYAVFAKKKYFFAALVVRFSNQRNVTFIDMHLNIEYVTRGEEQNIHLCL